MAARQNNNNKVNTAVFIIGLGDLCSLCKDTVHLLFCLAVTAGLQGFRSRAAQSISELHKSQTRQS